MPGRLPNRAMSQADVEVFWGRDRAALRTCGERHRLLADYVQGQIEASQ